MLLLSLTWFDNETVIVGPGRILSRIYNCTKHGNRPIDNAKLHILHWKFDFTTAQIVINCTLKYALSRPNRETKAIHKTPSFRESAYSCLYQYLESQDRVTGQNGTDKMA